MDISEEEKLLNEWIERLGLQDWVINFKPNQKSQDVDDGDSVGFTTYVATDKSAIIQIISPDEYEKEEYMLPFDFEKTLVHELLHIKFAPLELHKNSYESKVLEDVIHQLIDDLARTLVMAKRGETNRIESIMNLQYSQNCKKFLELQEGKEGYMENKEYK